jgi:hypothetical protein
MPTPNSARRAPLEEKKQKEEEDGPLSNKRLGFNSPADFYTMQDKPREQPVKKSTNWRTSDRVKKKSDCENPTCTDDNKHDTHQAHNVDHSKEHKENVAMRHEIESMRKQMDAREKMQWGMGECESFSHVAVHEAEIENEVVPAANFWDEPIKTPSDNYPDNFQPITEEFGLVISHNFDNFDRFEKAKSVTVHHVAYDSVFNGKNSKWLSWTWGECSLPWKWKKKGYIQYI